jgi:hypothetical protein
VCPEATGSLRIELVAQIGSRSVRADKRVSTGPPEFSDSRCRNMFEVSVGGGVLAIADAMTYGMIIG